MARIMGLKGKVEAIIYAAEEPVTLEQIAAALKEPFVAEHGVNGADGGALETALQQQLHRALDELVSEYARSERGMEIRQVAGGYRMATKPEHHDVVRSFARSLKAPVRLSLQALETLAVIAYKQPVTVPEINEIRGVDSSGVIGTLLDRKLITTAGRKAVIGRPILYRTSKEFLLRFGLKDVTELPSLEEFEKLAADSAQEELFPAPAADGPSQPPPAAPGAPPGPAPSADAEPAAGSAGGDDVIG